MTMNVWMCASVRSRQVFKIIIAKLSDALERSIIVEESCRAVIQRAQFSDWCDTLLLNTIHLFVHTSFTLHYHSYLVLMLTQYQRVYLHGCRAEPKGSNCSNSVRATTAFWLCWAELICTRDRRSQSRDADLNLHQPETCDVSDAFSEQYISRESPVKYEMLTRCRYDVGPASQTLT